MIFFFFHLTNFVIFDHRIKCDKGEDIKTKLKQISLEKIKLKQLDPTAIVTISKRIGLLQANAQKAAAKVVSNNINQGIISSEPVLAAAGNKTTKDIENPAIGTPEEKLAIQEIISSATKTVSSSEAPIIAENTTKLTDDSEISIADIVSIIGRRIVIDFFRLRLTSFQPVHFNSQRTKYQQQIRNRSSSKKNLFKKNLSRKNLLQKSPPPK